jgi:hypothetical protein
MARIRTDRATCLDCGQDTLPAGYPDRAEYYMVTDAIWTEAGMIIDAVPEACDQYLCIACLEARIGRRLVAGDFPRDIPINDASHVDDPRYAYTWRTPRLASRLAHT